MARLKIWRAPARITTDGKWAGSPPVEYTGVTQVKLEKEVFVINMSSGEMAYWPIDSVDHIEALP